MAVAVEAMDVAQTRTATRAAAASRNRRRTREETQQPQRGEEGGEAHGDLPSSEDGTEGASQLEEGGRLAVEALEDAVVDEARNEEVARFRHVRADGRVASLGRVEDGRDDHHGKPDDGQRDEQQNKTFQGVFHAT